MAKKYLQIGSIVEKKDKKKEFYIRIMKDVNLKEGDFVTMQKPEEKLKFWLDNGHIDETRYNELKEKIPTWVKYELVYVTE